MPRMTDRLQEFLQLMYQLLIFLYGLRCKFLIYLYIFFSQVNIGH